MVVYLVPEDFMKFEHPQFEDFWFGVEYKVSSRFEDQLDDYVKEIDAAIFTRSYEYPHEQKSIGKMQARLIELARADSEQISIWDVCDSIDGYLAAICEYFCDLPINKIKDNFSTAPADILAIEEIEIDPEYRGHRLGQFATLDLMRMFRRAGGICVMEPFSSQSFGEGTPAEQSKAFEKLNQYFAGVGFKQYTEAPEYLFRPMRKPMKLPKSSTQTEHIHVRPLVHLESVEQPFQAV